MTSPRHWISLGRRIPWAVGVLWALSATHPTHAILFYDTGDPTHNTSAPGGPLLDSGWQWQGSWGIFLGTPVHSKYFLTARHVGGQIGDPFLFGAQSYRTTAYRDVPGSDLRLWRICGTFPTFAPLHTDTNLAGLDLLYFGRGTRRAAEVYFTNLTQVELRGWRTGTQDTVLRWGRNRIESLLEDEDVGPLLVARFDTNGLPDECHLSAGDSGGAAFVRNGNQWALAAIHYGVDGPYSYSTNGPGFNAALFNHQGFFTAEGIDWLPVTPEPLPEPGALYSSSVAAHADWILAALAEPVPPDDTPVLQGASILTGTFIDLPNTTTDPIARTVRTALPGIITFYRFRGCVASRATGWTLEQGMLVLSYE